MSERKIGEREAEARRRREANYAEWEATERARRAKETKPLAALREATKQAQDHASAKVIARKAAKGGRPSLGKPWEAEGISRAEWFRRRGETNA